MAAFDIDALKASGDILTGAHTAPGAYHNTVDDTLEYFYYSGKDTFTTEKDPESGWESPEVQRPLIKIGSKAVADFITVEQFHSWLRELHSKAIGKYKKHERKRKLRPGAKK